MLRNKLLFSLITIVILIGGVNVIPAVEISCEHSEILGYFIDINNGLFDNITKEDNYKFISCGDRCGPLFLSLLKTYILLADIVASNTIGTQTGYSLFFNKPYWVILILQDIMMAQ